MSNKKVSWGSWWEYTPTGVSLAKSAGCFFTDVSQLQPGDIIWFYYTSLGRVGHTGIIETVNGKKITTIEGNTSSVDYDRSGGCVRQKSYTISSVGGTNSIYGFAHPQYGDLCTAAELVAVAQGEIGYQEKASNSQLDDPTANIGSNNYTKYGKWYGDNGVAWCAQFVCWCMNQACEIHIEEPADGWVEVSGKWQYIENGTPVKDQWREIQGRWYVFDNAGYMITGWFWDGSDWYYLASDGGMLAAQWLEIDGTWYYLDVNGVMVKDCYIRKNSTEYYVNSIGEWQSEYDRVVATIYDDATGTLI